MRTSSSDKFDDTFIKYFEFFDLVIDRFGKVGVGTNIPVSKFDVSVTADTIGVRISGNSTSDMLIVTQTGSGNAFVVEDSSNPNLSPFVVTSGGTVGIGTSNPNPNVEILSNLPDKEWLKSLYKLILR